MIIVNLSDIIFIHCNDVIIVHTLTHLLNGLLDNLLIIEKIIMNFILIFFLIFSMFFLYIMSKGIPSLSMFSFVGCTAL